MLLGQEGIHAQGPGLSEEEGPASSLHAGSSASVPFWEVSPSKASGATRPLCLQTEAGPLRFTPFCQAQAGQSGGGTGRSHGCDRRGGSV